MTGGEIPVLYAAVVQRLVYQPSKLRTGVRFPFAAPFVCFHDLQQSRKRDWSVRSIEYGRLIIIMWAATGHELKTDATERYQRRGEKFRDDMNTQIHMRNEVWMRCGNADQPTVSRRYVACSCVFCVFIHCDMIR